MVDDDEVHQLLDAMILHGYIVIVGDDLFQLSETPPPEDQPEVRAFWMRLREVWLEKQRRDEQA